MKPHNLVEMLSRTVKRAPDKTALMWKEDGKYQQMSYQKLWSMIRDFAFGLERLGIHQGTKVAILAEHNPRWLISDFAVLSLGAVSVPIPPKLEDEQITQILQHADVEAMIAKDSETLARVPELPGCVRHSILMYGTAAGDMKALQFETVMQIGQSVGMEDSDWAYPAIQSSDPATIVHTSGTTGDPKGVLLSHGNLLSSLDAAQHSVPCTSFDRFLSVFPSSGIFERMAGQMLPLYFGAAIAYAENEETVTENIREVRPTILVGVPRSFENIYRQIRSEMNGSRMKKYLFDLAAKLLNEYAQISSRGFNWPVPNHLLLKHALSHVLVFSSIRERLGGHLRFMIAGGGALAPEIHRFFHTLGIPVVETYGLTECSSLVSSNRPDQVRPGTAGKPLPGTEIRLLSDGELLVKSPSVMLGYYKQPDLTAKTVINGWLHTGDIAEIDENGHIRIIDRKKNVIAEPDAAAATSQ
ncbi:AMP-dependent synthetase/ligase [Lihuaxuella thermophila]|uniref:Long-chain acyl-CoA synthetase n=1 Tax=Lihuaxuella thermophila TaxID=1173111 RepID=A0A1H8IBF9_9BACL|nr:AMP-binding protein [Lihuaxuella thermophila]SEN65691.1 long-chain acyl-CoA synthetase [Lihuaxuella thermophila]